MRLCRHCNQPLIDLSYNRTLHEGCALALRRERDRIKGRLARGSAIGTQKICKQCGKLFAFSAQRKVYCTEDCYHDSRKRHPRVKEDELPGWGIPEAPKLHPGNVWFVSFNWRSI